MAIWFSTEDFDLASLGGVLGEEFLKSLRRPNPFLAAMMGHNKWYVRAVMFTRPRFVETFTQRPKRFGDMPIVHGYWCRHFLGFLYVWATRLATRKQKFNRDAKVAGQSLTFSLGGDDADLRL